jgi:hypothetical protein
MDDAAAPSLIDMPGWLLQHVTEPLHDVGIALPPFGLQAVLLCCVMAALFAFRKLFWPPEKANPASLLAGAAILLIGLTVLADWAMQAVFPLPGYLSGTIRAERLSDVSLALLDARDEQMNKDSGAVDSESGAFVLRYQIGVGEMPKTLVVKRSGCRDKSMLIGRAQLRAGTVEEVEFRCTAV